MSNKIKKAFQTDQVVEPKSYMPMPYGDVEPGDNNADYQKELDLLSAELNSLSTELKLSEEEVASEIKELFPAFMKHIVSNIKK